MSDNSNSGSNNGLYFIVGGLVVAMGVGFVLYSGGYFSPQSGQSTTVIERTVIPGLGSSETSTTTTKP